MAHNFDDCACLGGLTRTRPNAMGDMEECIVCGNRVAWDFKSKFWPGDKPCAHARQMAVDEPEAFKEFEAERVAEAAS